MAMENATSYWSPLCKLVIHLRCWARITWKEGEALNEGWWSQLLTIPVEGCLEAAGGPIPIRDIEWVDVSMNRLKGGLAGRSLQIVSSKDEFIAGLRDTQLNWELTDSTWSRPGLFENEPVQVARFVNPFGPGIDTKS